MNAAQFAAQLTFIVPHNSSFFGRTLSEALFFSYLLINSWKHSALNWSIWRVRSKASCRDFEFWRADCMVFRQMAVTCFSGNNRLQTRSILEFRHLKELNMDEQGNKCDLGSRWVVFQINSFPRGAISNPAKNSKCLYLCL